MKGRATCIWHRAVFRPFGQVSVAWFVRGGVTGLGRQFVGDRSPSAGNAVFQEHGLGAARPDPTAPVPAHRDRRRCGADRRCGGRARLGERRPGALCRVLVGQAGGGGRRHRAVTEPAELGELGADNVFFLVAGLEARREFDMGELRARRRLALPLAAGLAGMIVPAVIYLAFNTGQPSAHGWEPRCRPTPRSRWGCSRWPGRGCRIGCGPTW
jgi:hypothetical protein